MSRNHFYIPRYLSEMSSQDFGWIDNEDPLLSPFEGSETSSHEDSEMKCYCGLVARLRVSHTNKNPYRLFYNCPKNYDSQCEFFHWSDEPALTGDRHVDELNLIRNECTRLQGRMEEMEQQHNNDRSAWERERSELVSELSTVQNELDEIKRRIQSANESNLMPPLDRLSIVEDDGDDEIVKHTI